MPAGYIVVHSGLIARAGSAEEVAGVLSLLSTHPASSERSARLQLLMRDAPPLPPLGYDWAKLQASLSLPGNSEIRPVNPQSRLRAAPAG